MRAVTVPKHAFVRYDDGKLRLNLEPSMGGPAVSDAWVRRRYHKPGGAPPKLLSHLEIVGVLMSQTANNLALGGERERACALFARAAELAPRNSETYHNWGTNLLTLKKNAQAADKFARSVACDPGNTASHYSWAVALANMGQRRSACEHFARVVKADPKSANAFYNWGITLLQMNRRVEASEKFRKAVAIDPSLGPMVDRMESLFGRTGFDNRTWGPSHQPR